MKEYVCTICNTMEPSKIQKKIIVSHIRIREEDNPEDMGWSKVDDKWICGKHPESSWNERNKS